MSGSEPTTPSPGRALLDLPRAPTVPAPHRLYTRSSPSDLTPPALCSGNPPHIPSSGQGKGELGANPPLVIFLPPTHYMILGMLGKKFCLALSFLIRKMGTIACLLHSGNVEIQEGQRERASATQRSSRRQCPEAYTASGLPQLSQTLLTE